MKRISIFSAIAAFVLTGCAFDDGDKSPLVEFGLRKSEFTVNSSAGHADIEILSNQTCHISFLEGGPDWAELSKSTIKGDGTFYIDYDDNTGFPRMAKVLVEAKESSLRDTVFLYQEGEIVPTFSFPTSTLSLPGSSAGTAYAAIDSNLDWENIDKTVKFGDEEDADWLGTVSYDNGRLSVSYLSNNSPYNIRNAVIVFNYDNGWGEKQTSSLYIIQQTSNDTLGAEMQFEELRSLAVPGGEPVKIDNRLLVHGYVVSNPDSRNAGENPKTTTTTIDYTACDRTVYLESLDGSYGFMVETESEEDNIFKRYDKVQLSLEGTTLTAYDNPVRYVISGIRTSSVMSQETGTASAIPSKAKNIDELTDDDIYTFVTLKDCEFGVRKGSLTPVHEGYTNGKGQAMLSKYPRLIRDIEGSSLYLYTNTTCPWRRDGRRLPYGSGDISGVVVFEYFQPYIYGDGTDEDTHGRIGNYQMRLMSYEDIGFAESETFSNLLTEYRYMSGKTTDTEGYIRWYPTLGNNGYFYHSKANITITAPTSWNYLGPVGGNNGTAPFKDNTGNINGLGIILEDGTDYLADNDGINTDGQGQDGTTNGWKAYHFWDSAKGNPWGWVCKFSTSGISANVLSMQFTIQSGRGVLNCTPVYWKAEWSVTGKADGEWTYIGSFQQPDFPIFATYREWQLPAFKQIDMKLPLEMLGKSEVYIRLVPENDIANTLQWGAGKVNGSGDNSGSAMDYFAIRYN